MLNFLNSGYELDYILTEVKFEEFSSSEELIEYLINEGYLLDKSINNEVLTNEEIAKKYTVPELKELLKKHKLKVSGNKQTLIERLLPTLKKMKSSEKPQTQNYELSDKAKDFLKKNQWIDLYTYALIMFKFEDYEAYVKSSSDDLINTALNFCDEILSIALINDQFLTFINALTAKAHVYAYTRDYESFLDYDLQRFILGLNPIILDAQTYATYTIIDYANIINLKNVTEKFDFGRLKNRFNKIWVKSNIKNVTVPKKATFKYLKRAISGADIEELNFELKEKYFNKKFGL